MLEIIPQELELFNFPNRSIVAVDTFNNLRDMLVSIKLQQTTDEFDPTLAF